MENCQSNSDTLVIKSEYLITDHIPTLVLGCIQPQDQEQLLKKKESIAKKLKLNKWHKKSILKGQNKARGPTFKQEKTIKLCSKLIDVGENETTPVCSTENCEYIHDIDLYFKSKPPDINNECYVFSVHGYCPRGITCRFGRHHLTDSGKNIRNVQLKNHNFKYSSNILTKNVQHSLRKKNYDFSKSENIVKLFDTRKTDSSKKCENLSTVEINNESSAKIFEFSEDSDLIRLQKREKKIINWNHKLVLSPLTTVGNLPFRRICKEFGADVTCGEMALASSLLQGAQQEWALVRRHHTEDIFGVQICGNNPYVMTKCAQLLQEQIDIDFLDVNLGCPIDLIYQQGAGSGLLRRERILENILNCMNYVLDIPLTIKTRTGVYKDSRVLHNLMPRFVKCGVSLISIHGRTREQRYTKSADWNYIEECAKLSADVPVYGNGDILSYTDYETVLNKYPHISGVLIARGALYKPWLFTEIKEQRHWDISSSERMEILKKYVNYGLEHWGSDDKGVENTRRFLLEWLSFLHRYVPVGLLERPPQKINQRPPIYKGRDDLETLFASPNCGDWIKISEMLLGPVPEEFYFLPKHKASSWK